jgi:hypothetical protein
VVANKKSRSHGGRRKGAYGLRTIAVTAVFVIILLGVLPLYVYDVISTPINRAGPYEPILQSNIKLADVNAVTTGAPGGYTAISTANVISFGAPLAGSGYLYASTSVFNATTFVPDTRYPQTISSLITITSNATVASDAEEAELADYPGVVQEANGTPIGNMTNVINFTYNGSTTKIYHIKTIAMFNVYLNGNTTPYHIYQDISTFVYKSVDVVVAADGSYNLSQTYSVPLAEKDLENIINAEGHL